MKPNIPIEPEALSIAQACAVIARDVGVVISLALQHHVEIETLRHAVTRDARGEAASLVGAVVDALIVRGAA